MANRDIEFVIRARDEATRAIDGLISSLVNLQGVEEGVAASGSKTDAFLGNLANSFKALKEQGTGLNVLSKVGEDIAKVEAVLSTLGDKFKKNSDQLAFFAAESNKAAATVETLRAALEKSKASLGTESSAYATLKRELSDLTKEFERANATIKAFPAAEEAATAATQKLAAQQEKQIATLDRLRAKMAQTSAPTTASTDKEVESYKRLEAQISRAEAALSKTEQRIATSAAKTAELASANARAETTVAGFAARQTELNNSLAKSEASVAGFKSQVAGTETVLKQAEASTTAMGNAFSRMLTTMEKDVATISAVKAALTSMSGDAQRGADTLNVTSASLDQIGQAAKRNAAQVKEIGEALKSLGKDGSIKAPVIEMPPNTLAGYKSLIQAVRDAKTAMEAARAETTRTGAAMAEAGRYTAEEAAAFALVKMKAQEAEATFLATGRALAEFKGQASGSFLALEKTIAALGETGAKAGTVNAQLRGTAGAISEMASASQRANGATGAFAAGITSLYGESRQAMSWLQRLRGEILALATSYAGFQGLISGFQAVVNAIRTVEAASNRLGAAFDQDFTKANQAFDQVRAQSLRLGQSFQVASNEYGKFAIAAKEANFSIDGTNKVFRSVAESARVNKLSVDELKGVYLALTQMISKGKVTSEELRRQLGDRLPGAFNIMAKAVGVTTAELDKMMREGKVLADEKTLTKFADELSKRYGAQLPAAIKSTSYALDSFFNLLEQGAQRVAEGGLDEALAGALKKVNDLLNSRAGRDFFLAIGAAAGRLVEVLGALANNAGLVATALGAIAAVKVANALLAMAANSIRSAAGLNEVAAATERVNVTSGITAGLVLKTATGFGSLGAAAVATAARFTAFSTEVRSIGLTLAGVAGQTNILTRSMAAVGGVFSGIAPAIAAARTSYSALATSMAAAGAQTVAARVAALALAPATIALGGAVRLAAVSFRTLYAAVGGLPGILASVAVYFAGEWLAGLAGKVDDATTAIDEHKRIVDEVAKAYDGAVNKANGWQSALKDQNVTGDQIVANVRKQKELFDQSRDAAKNYYLGMANSAKLAFDGQAEQVKQLQSQFGASTITATKFREELEKIYVAAKSDELKKYIEGLLDLARKSESAGFRLSEAAEAAKKFGAAIPDIGKGFEQVKSVGDGAKWSADMMKLLDEAYSKTGETIKKTSKYGEDLPKGLSELGDSKGKLQDVGDAAKKVGDGLSDVSKEAKKADAALANAGAGAKGMDKVGEAGRFVVTSFRDVTDEVTKANASLQKTGDAVEGIKNAPSSALQTITAAAQSTWQAMVNGFQSAVSSIEGFFADLASTVQGYFNSIMSWLSSIISKAGEAKSATSNVGGGSTVARAQGGPVYGPGTPTSDSILARLSTGEFVVRAKAVAAYGLNFLRNVNSMRYVPAYAAGGVVGVANRVARMPAASGLQSAHRPINLSIDGQTFKGLMAPVDTADAIIRFSRAREARSAGRKPNWS